MLFDSASLALNKECLIFLSWCEEGSEPYHSQLLLNNEYMSV